MQKVKARVNEYEVQVSSLSASKSMIDYATDEKVEKTAQELEQNKNTYDNKSKELQELSASWGEQKQTLEKLKNLKKINSDLEEMNSKKDEISALQSEIDKSQSANALKSDFEKLKKDESDAKDLSIKISELGELKLKKASEVVETENNFNKSM
jgi:predicted  nucleic acid-binding Zn-ribbon protein